MARDDAYREAEQRIAAARQEGATELDLSEMELTEVEAIVLLLQPAEVQAAEKVELLL